MRNREEYDWIDDPFDEKKIAEEQQRMTRGSKTAVGCAAAAVVVIAIGVLLVIVARIA